MKNWLLYVFFGVRLVLPAQTIDSSAIWQVDSLIQVSRALTGKKNFDKALEVNTIAEKFALEKFGRVSAAYGSCCFNHGRVLYIKGDYPEAEKWYIAGKEIQEKVLGKENPEYASSLNKLALLYYDMGSYEKAEPLYEEVLAIRSRAFRMGKEHPEYAASLNDLANLYRDMGQYEKAERLYLEALSILEKVLGKEHPDYATSLNSLAILYRFMGNFEKAERIYLEALAIREKVLGKEHPDYASSLNSLAILYRLMGNYEKAEPLCIESIIIREKVLGKEHPVYASSLSNLAGVYLALGNYEKAERIFLEALAIREKILGKEHPLYAESLNNLANLYFEIGRYEKAEPLYLEALTIREKVLGKEHPSYAFSVHTLAILYHTMGNYEKAEPLYQEALTIREKVLGKEHPYYALTMYKLAVLYQAMGNYNKAKPLYIEANNINRLLVKKAATYSSENQMLTYLSTFKESLETFQSFSQQHPSPETNRENYNNALFFNGLVLENERLLARAIAGADTATLALYKKLQNARLRLAKRYAKPIAERKKIAETEAEAEDYEKMLVRKLSAFRETQTVPQWQEVRDRLKPGEAAIEFVHYRFYKPEATDSVLYAALLLQHDWDTPQMIPLFEEKQLDSFLLSTGGRKVDYVTKIYAVAERGIIAVDKPSSSLYELIWQPLEKALTGIHTVYFAPTGLLHRLNLSAIPITTDTVLADRYHLIELGSTRSLAQGTKSKQLASAGQAYHNQIAAIFGGIQYEMDSTAIFAANARLIHADIASSRGLEEGDNLDSTGHNGTWGYLKWTEKEVNVLAPILTAAGFATDTRKGFDATEEAFKSIGSLQGDKGGSPRVIHLATHGFFFPDPQDTLKKRVTIDVQETGFKTSDNPLIRSGLLMAGANYAWKNGKPIKKGMENGILTAYEISHLDLSQTELVVLSACETGLGDIAGNEGVFGLQRAFKIAGAKYLIMSLWQVPDFQTQDLMTTFYSYWLPSAVEAMAGKSEKKSIPEAFRAAQQDMREKYLDPYFWAGFVLVQ